MKIPTFLIAVTTAILMLGCQTSTSDQPGQSPDYATSEKNMQSLRAFLQAHCDEDITTMSSMVADTLKWSPPNLNDGSFLGKDEFMAQIATYHADFENTRFEEGVGIGAGTNGIWAGSVYPKENANSNPSILRAYGTWVTTHSATGKGVRVKWYALIGFNDAGQIALFSEWFDVNGIAVQIGAGE